MNSLFELQSSSRYKILARPANLLERNSVVGVILWNVLNFCNSFFKEHLRAAATGRKNYIFTLEILGECLHTIKWYKCIYPNFTTANLHTTCLGGNVILKFFMLVYDIMNITMIMSLPNFRQTTFLCPIPAICQNSERNTHNVVLLLVKLQTTLPIKNSIIVIFLNTYVWRRLPINLGR